MKTLFTLLKNNFLNTFKINKILKNSKKKLILYSFLVFLLIAYIFGVTTFYAVIASNFLAKYNMLNMLLILFFVLATFSTFMFTIYHAKSGLFNANDNDMLLSMPIKTSTLIMSRLLNLIISNLLFTLIITLPAIVVYAVKVDVSYTYYIAVFFIFLLLPIIPTVLAALLGYFIAYLTAKSNMKNWFEIIISLIFVFGIMFLTSYGSKLLTLMVDNPKVIEDILKYGFYPIYLAGQVFTDYNLLPLVYFILINVWALIMFVLVLNSNYKSIISKLSETKAKTNYKMKELKTESINKALFKKDLKRYFSSPIYVLNTSFGVLMILIVSIGSIFYSTNKILDLLQLSGDQLTPFMMATLFVTFVVFMSNIAASSISIEGKNFWILKTLPISYKKILDSKLLLNIFIILPLVFLSIIILKFTFVLSILEMLMLMILASISTIVMAEFGLLVNLKFPKMDAISDTVVVKQSVSSVITVMIPMVIIFTFTGIYGEIGKNIHFYHFVVILTFIFFIIAGIERLILNKWGIKRLKEIN